MSTASISSDAIVSFRDFVVGATNVDLGYGYGDKKPACLADFIRPWVTSGVGVRACAGDFQTYLIGVIAIMDDWLTFEDNALLDYIGDADDPNDPTVLRRVTTIFGDRKNVEDILDPHFFARYAFRHLHPRREEAQ